MEDTKILGDFPSDFGGPPCKNIDSNSLEEKQSLQYPTLPYPSSNGLGHGHQFLDESNWNKNIVSDITRNPSLHTSSSSSSSSSSFSSCDGKANEGNSSSNRRTLPASQSISDREPVCLKSPSALSCDRVPAPEARIQSPSVPHRQTDGHFRPRNLPLRNDFQPDFDARWSRVPRQDAGCSQIVNSENEKFHPKHSLDSRNENFARDYSKNGMHYRGQVEFPYQDQDQDLRLRSGSVYDPRLAYRYPPPSYVDPHFAYNAQQDPRFRDPNSEFHGERIRLDCHDHESRSNHDCQDGFHEAIYPDDDGSRSQFIANSQFRPSERIPYPGSMYPNSGFSGYTNHPHLCDPRFLDRFSHEFVYSNARNNCPCCQGHPQKELRVPYHPGYASHGIQGDGRWNPGYFDCNIPPIGYRDCRYSGYYPNCDIQGQIQQNSKPQEIREEQNSQITNNQKNVKTSVLQEQSPQNSSNQLESKDTDGSENLKTTAKNEFKRDSEEIPANTGNRVDGSSHRNRSAADRADEPIRSRENEDAKYLKSHESTAEDSGKHAAKPSDPPAQSRVSYFLNLDPPTLGKNSFHSNETKKPSAASKTKKSPTLTSPAESRDSLAVHNGSNHLKNRSRDDNAMKSPPATDQGFVRGGSRRSLQLPRDRHPVASRIFSGTSSKAGKSGGDTVRVQDPSPSSTGKGLATRGRPESARTGPSNSSMHDVSTGLRARGQGRPEATRDEDTLGKREAMDRARTVGIYASYRRPKKSLPTLDDQSPFTGQGNFLARSKAVIPPAKTLALKSEHSIRDQQSTSGGGEGEGGGGGKGEGVLSPASNKQMEGEKQLDDDDDGDACLDSDSEFMDLEQAFNSVMSVFSAGRTANAGVKSEKSSVGTSSLQHSSKKSNPHVPLTGRTQSNPIHVSTKKPDGGESIGKENTNGDFGASNKSNPSEDHISSLMSTVGRHSTRRTRRPKSAIYFGEKNRYDDDTASVLSDTLSTSSLRSSTVMTDVFHNLSSSSVMSRKDGLGELQYLLRSGTVLSRKDIKRLTEVFTRMFHEPQTKVFSLFVEVLMEFIQDHDEDLEEWLPVCLERLLMKLGTDLLGSVLNKVQRTLEAIRNTFRFELQLNALAKFVSEPTHTSNAKVKAAALDHVQFLLEAMNPSDLDADNEALVVVLDAVIAYAMDAKPSGSKKTSQKLIVTLFNLSPPTFSAILNKQSKPAQDFVRKLLHSDLRSVPSSIEEDEEFPDESVTPNDSGTVRFRRDPTCRSMASNLDTIGRHSFRRTALGGSQTTISRPSKGREDGSTHATTPTFVRERPVRRSTRANPAGGRSERDEEVGRGRALGSVRAEEEVRMNRMSKDSGIFFASEETRGELSPEVNGRPVFSPDEAKPVDDFGFGRTDASLDNMIGGGEDVVNESKNWKDEGKFKPEEDISEDAGSWQDVLHTFSDLNSSEDQRKEAMKTLIKDLPADFKEIPDSSLKTLLSILCLASNRTDEVSEMADECIFLLLKTRSARGRVALLRDVAAAAADFQIRTCALKLQYSELQNLTQQEIKQVLHEVVPSLITAYEDNESRVRKASLLCLVQLYKVVRDELWPYIENINDNKKNLLMMYFKRTSTAYQTMSRID